MSIKKIFDEIAAESSSNKKMEILKSYKDNELLRDVLYQANSKRIKFYIKQIPEYLFKNVSMPLSVALTGLKELSSRRLTGHAGVFHLVKILENVSADDAYIIERIIEKDCKIGMGTSNINKIFPKLIEDTPYMGAKAFEEDLARKIFQGGKAYSQMKMDGRYANAIIRGGDVELESRQGEPTLLEGAEFLKDLSCFQDCVLNGELTMDSIETTTTFEKNELVEIDGIEYTTEEIIKKFG